MIIKIEASSNESYGCNPENRNVREMIDYGIVIINKFERSTSHQISDYVKK